MTWVETVQAAWENPELNWTLRDWQQNERMHALVSFVRRQGEWDLFWTQTFRGRHSASAAQARWLSFLADFNSRYPLTAACWAVEPHKNSPSHHVHALLSMVSRKPSTIFARDWRIWKEECWRTMGKAMILPVRKGTAEWYVLKYALKVNVSTSGEATAGTPENLWGVLTRHPESGLLQ